MKQCNLIDKLEKEIKIKFWSFIIIVIILIFIIIFLVLKVYNIKLNFGINLDTFVNFLAIIIAVIISRNEIRESTRVQIEAIEFEKFRDNLDSQINKYIEFSNQFYQSPIRLQSEACAEVILRDDIEKNVLLMNNYKSFITTVINDITYYYGDFTGERPAFKTFIDELKRINTIILERIQQTVNLFEEMHNINVSVSTENFDKISLYKKANEEIIRYYRIRRDIFLNLNDIVIIKQQAFNVIAEKKMAIKTKNK